MFLTPGNLNGLLGALTDTEREMISVERMNEYCEPSRHENRQGLAQESFAPGGTGVDSGDEESETVMLAR